MLFLGKKVVGIKKTHPNQPAVGGISIYSQLDVVFARHRLNVSLLLMEEILHHLGCIKPCN